MKLKRIKRMKDLKAGWVIRAVVNPHGAFWIEKWFVHGRPYNCKSYRDLGYQIKVKHSLSVYEDGYFLSSLGVHDQVKNRNSKTTAFVFSNKTWNYLSSFLKSDVRTFIDVITGQVMSDEAYRKLSEYWEYNRYMDKQADAMRDQAMQEQSDADWAGSMGKRLELVKQISEALPNGGIPEGYNKTMRTQ